MSARQLTGSPAKRGRLAACTAFAIGALGALGASSAVLAVSACSRSPAPSAASEEAGAAPAAASASPTPAPSTPAAGPTSWSGTYAASPGTLFVPDGGEWSGVKFRGDDAGTGLGAGTLSLTIDGATGRAEGTGAGPLGDLVVRGLLRDGTLTARLEPKDVTSGGFTGFALGKLEGGAIKGTMRLSTDTGSIIREGTFSLEKK